LDGKTSVPASSSDRELRSLEETILRLNQAFPPQSMDNNTRKRMLFDFKIRQQKIEAPSRPVIWRSQQMFQRIGLAVAVSAILIAILLMIPSFITGSGSMQASAGLHSQSIGLLVILVGAVLLLGFWLARRK